MVSINPRQNSGNGSALLTIDELKSKLGTELKPVVYEIEKGMIRKFVQAVDDPNPRWQEVTPPTLILTIGLEQVQQLVLDSFASATVLHGSTELNCYQTVRPGDTLTAITRITNVRERQGQMGKMAFITFDTAYENQKQEPVARCRQMIISY